MSKQAKEWVIVGAKQVDWDCFMQLQDKCFKINQHTNKWMNEQTNSQTNKWLWVQSSGRSLFMQLQIFFF